MGISLRNKGATLLHSFHRLVLATVAGLLLAGCAAGQAVPPAALPVTASAGAEAPQARPAIVAPYQGALPNYATKSADTEAAYRWAATNRSILQYFQCTCGCEGGGHQSNWNCYVKEEKPGGKYVWDPMSAG